MIKTSEPNFVQLVDDTLREGMQTPGLTFSFRERLKLANLIRRTGVTRAVVSYPSAHPSELEFTKRITEDRIFDVAYGLGRAITKDAAEILASGADAYLYLPFDLSLNDEILRSLAMITDSGRKLRISIPRAYELESTRLTELVSSLEKYEPDSLVIPDTTGMACPSRVRSVMAGLKEITEIPLGVHFHDDLGLSVANSLAAVEEGADSTDVTILGIGERNGITDASIMVRLLNSEGYRTGTEYDKFDDVYDYMIEVIAEKVGVDFFSDKIPIWGRNCSVHTGGTHAAFGSIFRGTNYSFNVYAGKTMVRQFLMDHDLPSDDHTVICVLKKVKDTSSREGRSIRFDEIITMAGECNDKSY